MQIKFDPTARPVVGVRPVDDFHLATTEEPRATGASVADVVDKDVTVSRSTGGVQVNEFRINVAESPIFPGKQFTSQTPAVCSVDADGKVTWIANGTAIVDVKTPAGTRRYSRTMTNTGAAAFNRFKSYQAGTLGKHITDAMLALIAGKTAGDATKNLFTSNNYSTATPSATRNPAAFTAGLDLSPMSVVNSWSNGAPTYQHPALLISPRHIIGAAHYQVYGPIVFMRPDGTFQTVGVTSRKTVLAGGRAADTYVAYLDAPVTGVVPFKLLPANYKSYLPSAQQATMPTYHRIPVLTKTAHNAAGGPADQISITDLRYIQTASSAVSEFAFVGSLAGIADAPRLDTEAWYSPIIGGDSGGPIFAPINGQLALLAAYYQAAGGFHYADFAADINAAMNSLASAAGDNTTYAVQTVDLSGFTSYP